MNVVLWYNHSGSRQVIVTVTVQRESDHLLFLRHLQRCPSVSVSMLYNGWMSISVGLLHLPILSCDMHAGLELFEVTHRQTDRQAERTGDKNSAASRDNRACQQSVCSS